MFCRKCGRYIHEDHVFCPQCGNDVPKASSSGQQKAENQFLQILNKIWWFPLKPVPKDRETN